MTTGLAYDEAEHMKILNSPPAGKFLMTTEDLESLAGGVVPEWLKYDADAALASPPDVTPVENAAFVEGFDAACNEITRDLNRLLGEAITGERKDAYEKAIAAVAHQKAWS